VDLKKVDVSALTRQLHAEAANACESLQRSAERMIDDVASAVDAAKILAPKAGDLIATADVAAVAHVYLPQKIERGQIMMMLWGNSLAIFNDVSVEPGTYRALLFLVKK